MYRMQSNHWCRNGRTMHAWAPVVFAHDVQSKSEDLILCALYSEINILPGRPDLCISMQKWEDHVHFKVSGVHTGSTILVRWFDPIRLVQWNSSIVRATYPVYRYAEIGGPRALALQRFLHRKYNLSQNIWSYTCCIMELTYCRGDLTGVSVCRNGRSTCAWTARMVGRRWRLTVRQLQCVRGNEFIQQPGQLCERWTWIASMT